MSYSRSMKGEASERHWSATARFCFWIQLRRHRTFDGSIASQLQSLSNLVSWIGLERARFYSGSATYPGVQLPF